MAISSTTRDDHQNASAGDETFEEWEYDAYRTFVERSMKSQRGWARRGGPNSHLTLEQQSQLANLRAAEHLFLLKNPKPPVDKPDLPF